MNINESKEPRTFNPLVAGSNPARPTKVCKGLASANPFLLANLIDQI